MSSMKVIDCFKCSDSSDYCFYCRGSGMLMKFSNVTCSQCKGSGSDLTTAFLFDCSTCDGSGKMVVRLPDSLRYAKL